MKRVLSSIFVASSLLLGSTLASVSYAADAAPAKPDAKKGEQLFVNGDAARGILACASCHGAAGNSTIPTNPNLAAQPHEYLAKQLGDFRSKDGKQPPLRRGVNGANTVMPASCCHTASWPASMPRYSRYHAALASGSRLRKKRPPIPVTAIATNISGER